MAEHQHIQPAFSPETFAPDPNILLQDLSQAIDAEPEAHLVALFSLHDANPVDEVRRQFPDLPISEKTQIDGDALRRVGIVYSNKFDKAIVFDDATEAALASDQHMRSLIRAVHNRKAQRASAPGGRYEQRENPLAVEARDAARTYRLAFYIARVAMWNNQMQDTKRSMPDAS